MEKDERRQKNLRLMAIEKDAPCPVRKFIRKIRIARNAPPLRDLAHLRAILPIRAMGICSANNANRASAFVKISDEAKNDRAIANFALGSAL
jgi:hypothetical protein